MRKLILLLILSLGTSYTAWAQDPIFTQYFLFPETLNAGFTGFQETTKVGLLHRTQWPSLDFRIDSDFATFNTWVPSMNSGIGVSALSQRERFSNFSLTQANVNYAYKVNLTDRWVFRPGVEVGYGFKSFNFNNLILEDQINLASGTINPSTVDGLGINDNIGYLDLSASLLIHDDNLWLGASLKHLNRPDISLTADGNVELQPLGTITAGYELQLADMLGGTFLPYATKLLLTANYMQQGDFNRLDLGGMLVIDNFYVGALAATNPNRNTENAHLLTSVNLLGGLQFDKFKFGLSYDINVSNLGRTGGIYELSVIYTLDQNAQCFGCPGY